MGRSRELDRGVVAPGRGGHGKALELANLVCGKILRDQALALAQADQASGTQRRMGQQPLLFLGRRFSGDQPEPIIYIGAGSGLGQHCGSLSRRGLGSCCCLGSELLQGAGKLIGVSSEGAARRARVRIVLHCFPWCIGNCDIFPLVTLDFTCYVIPARRQAAA